MKLIIQIPCLNEHDQLEQTIADLPRKIPGINQIEVLIVDDGSTDGTANKAESLGVHYIIKFPQNRGLSAAHSAGLEACLKLGADIVVNTDADNQYRGNDIARLVEPIILKRADLVIGDRRTDTVEEFSLLKKLLQRWGTSVVKYASGTSVCDSTSGFRAINRKAMAQLFVYNRFSYTLETIIQAGRLGLAIENVPIQINAQTRSSRLSSSMLDYLRKNGPVIFRSYSLYWPVQTFGCISLLLFIFGSVLGLRFLYYFFLDPSVSSHIQSLMVGVGAIVMAFVVGLMALLGDLLGMNRRLLEETLVKVRHLEAQYYQATSKDLALHGIYSTGHAAWV